MGDFANVVLLSVAGFALLVGPADADRQAARAGDSGHRIATALRFMAAMYPEEVGPAGLAQITGQLYAEMEMREFRLHFGARDVPPLGTVADAHRAECYGTFRFARGALSEYHAGGKCIRQAEYATFLQAANSHPGWSDDDLTRDLAKRGAAYGPKSKDRLMRRLPDASVIADAVGETIELRGVEFETASEDDDGKRLTIEATWTVTYAVVGPENATVIAQLEPFGGRLMMLLRLPVIE